MWLLKIHSMTKKLCFQIPSLIAPLLRLIHGAAALDDKDLLVSSDQDNSLLCVYIPPWASWDLTV